MQPTQFQSLFELKYFFEPRDKKHILPTSFFQLTFMAHALYT